MPNPWIGVGASGRTGGDHTITMLKKQLQQVMEQVGCEKVRTFPKRLTWTTSKSRFSP